ncbi:MAG: ATPase AAA [Desulfotomaculum sp. BICA1-6]|nr:MAG: ATPase AAA [Peptococcaceae bacterium BRH_c8a]KJS75253.1 MAG: ATPase AAA [Desulfotomaculum sp. BICA1-6]
MTVKPHILVIDDEVEVGSFLRRLLERKGMDVSLAHTGARALQLIECKSYNAALIDLKLPDSSGLDLLERLKFKQPDCEAVIMTGYGTTKSAVRAIQLGAFDYIEKPFEDITEVEGLIDGILEQGQSNGSKSGGRPGWLDIAEKAGFYVGNTTKMLHLVNVTEKIARKNLNVLIQGETGTGKEVLARFIHIASQRSEQLFIPVNCGALPENLLESELFGHERGAFTGASSLRRGIFEVADKGTLFLDEIGEASLPIQIKLLRVLETGEFIRLGGEKPIKTDVRIIAATNIDLEKAVRDRQFREDLFYRLDVVRLDLPPLRERKEDISALVSHFIAHSKIGDNRTLQLSPEAMQILLNYNWPGNIRELLNTVEQSLALCESEAILPSHLAQKLTAGGEIEPEQDAGNEDNSAYANTVSHAPVEMLKRLINCAEQQDSLTSDNIRQAYQLTLNLEQRLLKKMQYLGIQFPEPLSLEEIEKQAVARTLAYFEGNISTAARSLGIGRNTLYRKIKEYGLE